MRASSVAWLLCCVFIAAVHFFYYPKWRQSGTEATLSYDVSGYYLYLPATFIYKDLRQVAFFPELLEKYRPTWGDYQTFAYDGDDGPQVMKYSMGQAVLFAPWFFPAHAWAVNSPQYPPDGFSFPYQFGISMGCLLYTFLGLWLLVLVLRRYFSEGAVTQGLGILVLGTNLLNYTAVDGAMTHNTVFLLYAALLLATDNFYRRPGYGWALVIGGCIGLGALTRPTEVLMAVLPLGWGMREGLGLRWYRERWPYFTLAILTVAAIGSLQLFYWKYVTGDWIVYSYEDQGFDWLHPHLLDGLFSYKAGWLVYTPVMVFALIGFYPLYRQLPKRFPALLVHSVLFIYVAFAWSIWWYGGSLGQRTMVQAYAVLSFPLLAFLTWMSRFPGWLKIVLSVLIATCIAHNLWFTHQAHRGGLFQSEQMTRAYYWRTLFKFRHDPADKLRLDNQDWFDAPVRHADTLVVFRFEDAPPCPTAALGPLSGRGSFCMEGRRQNLPVRRVPVDLAAGDYIRATLKTRINARRSNRWQYAQLLIHFYRDGEEVRRRLIRAHHLLNEDWGADLYIDGRTPRGGADAVGISIWNGGDDQPALVVDDLVVMAIR